MNELTITLERVHDVLDDDGSGPGEHRVLVARLCPRGVKKERLAHDDWDNSVTPSPGLRRALHDGDLDSTEVSRLYRREPDDSDAPSARPAGAREAAPEQSVPPFAAKDTAHTHARVLQEAREELQR